MAKLPEKEGHGISVGLQIVDADVVPRFPLDRPQNRLSLWRSRSCPRDHFSADPQRNCVVGGATVNEHGWAWRIVEYLHVGR